MTASKRHAPSMYNTYAEQYITMPIALHHHSNMTLHMNQLLYPFYTLCRLGEAAGSCDGKQMGKMPLRTTALRRFPACGGWRSGRGADTVQLTPPSAGTSAMPHRQ